MKIDFIFLLLFMCVSCTRHDLQLKPGALLAMVGKIGGRAGIATNTAEIVFPIDRNDSVTKERLYGIWAAEGEGNAAFEIKRGSIYYPDLSKSYRYVVSNDSLIIQFDGYKSISAISFITNDKLILTGDEKQTYYRFKK